MSASSLFVDGGDSKIDTRFISPLNAPLSAGGFAIDGVASVSAAEVRTEQLALPAGSLATAIVVQDPLQADLSRSGIAIIPIGATFVDVPAAGVAASSSVIVATLREVDATAAAVWSVVPGAGTFRINVNAAATADTEVSWFVAKV